MTERKDPRILHFMVLAAVLLGAGATLHGFEVGIWPWVLYGTAAFALLQACVKWADSLIAYCPECYNRTTLWPWPARR